MKEVDVLGKEQLFVCDMLWSLMLFLKVSEILGYISCHQNVFDISMFIGVRNF